MTLGHTSCVTLARACVCRGNRFARATRLAAVLGGVILLTGCGAREFPALPPAPVILKLPDCPAPLPPVLSLLDAALPLDNPANVEALLERDDAVRVYVRGLTSTVECYKRRQ